MSETILVRFPEISGDVSGYTAFLRHSTTGALLNTGGDAITESGATGLWSFTLAETRAANTDYDVAIYSGSSETAANLVYDDTLRNGLTRVGAVFEPTSTTIIRGTVGSATTPSITTFTPSALTTSGTALNQWRGRVLLFDNATTTAALRGQGTLITGNSAAALPLIAVEALTTAPATGDTFSVV